MSVRSTPRFTGDSLFRVAPGAFVEAYSRSKYQVHKFVFRDSAGVEQEAFRSKHVLAYEGLTSSLPNAVQLPAVSSFPSAGRMSDLDASEATKIAAELYAARCEEKTPVINSASEALSAIVRSTRSDRLLYDARAVSYVLAARQGITRSAKDKLMMVSEAAYVASTVHGEAHGESWAVISEAVRKAGEVTPTMVELESRACLIQSLLQLCENASIPDYSSCQVVDSVFANTYGYKGHLANRMQHAFSAVVPGLLLGLVHELPDLLVRGEVGEKLQGDIDMLNYKLLNTKNPAAQVIELCTSLGELIDLADDTDDAESAVVLTNYFQKLAQSLRTTARSSVNLCGYAYEGVGTAVASTQGVILMNDERTVVLSRTDLQHCLEVQRECLAQYLAFCVEKTREDAERFRTQWLRYHYLVSELEDDHAAISACCQRDLDLLYKNSAIGDIGSLGEELHLKVSALFESYGPAAGPTRSLSPMWAGLDAVNTYSVVRSFRLIVSTWFSAVYFVNQTFMVYHLGARATPNGIAAVRVALKQVIASSHLSRTGSFPKSVQKIFDEQFPELLEQALATGNISPEVADRWELNADGASLWDPSAARVRDKTNIIHEYANFESCENVKMLTPEQTREILHYAGQTAPDAAEAQRQKLVAGTLPACPVVIAAKPEQKPGSRVVAMEECGRRKLNSVIQNNAMGIASTLHGSLMAASASKLQKLEAENTSMLGANSDRAQRHVCAMFGIDFTKFGHYIAHDLQMAVAETLDTYFGTNFIALHMAALKEQVIVVHPTGLFVKFLNIEGADGQGLRNGMWQMMLGALGMLVFQRIRRDVPDIMAELKILLVWFMDDNNYPIRLALPKGVSLVDTEAVMRHVRSRSQQVRDVIEASYGECGILAEASKATTSLHGYGQTGDVILLGGVMRTTGKALQTALSMPAHVAPAIDDLVTVPVSAFAGAMSNGCRVVAAYIHMLWAAAYQMWEAGCRYPKKSVAAAGFMLACPRCLDGLGVPPIPAAVVDRGIFSSDDAIFSVISLANSESALKRFARDVLTRPRQAFKANQWASSPLFSRTQSKVDRRNAVDVMLKRTAIATSIFRIPELKDRRSRAISDLISDYAALPTTVPLAVWRNSPASVAEAELMTLANSATAKNLLTSAEVRQCRRTNRLRARAYAMTFFSLGASPKPSTGTGHLDVLATLRHLGHPGSPVDTTHPCRFPLMHLCEPEPEADPGNGVYLSLADRPAVIGTRSLTATTSGTTTTLLGNIWMDASMSALVGSVDASYATKFAGGEDGLYDIEKSLWGGVDLHGLAAVERNAYIELSAVAFVPPTHCPGLKRLANVRTLNFKALDDVTSGFPDRAHCNYYMLEVAALLHEEVGCRRYRGVYPMESAIWADPYCTQRPADEDKPPSTQSSHDPTSAAVVLRAYCAMATAVDTLRAPVPYDMKIVESLHDLTLTIANATLDYPSSMTEGMADGITSWAVDDLTATLMTIPVNSKHHRPYRARTEAAIAAIAGCCYHEVVPTDYRIALHITGAANDYAQTATLKGDADCPSWFKQLKPTERRIGAFTTALRASGALSDAIQYVSGIARSGSHGLAPERCTTFSDLLQRAVTFNPRWWLLRLAAHVHAVRPITVTTNSAHRMRAFFGCWAGKYGQDLRQAEAVVIAAKTLAGWPDWISGREIMPENFFSAYTFALQYAALVFVFSGLAKTEDIEPGSVVPRFDSLALEYISRHHLKFGIPWAADRTTVQLVELVAAARGRLQANRLQSAANGINLRRQYVAGDVGVPLRLHISERFLPKPTRLEDTHVDSAQETTPSSFNSRLRLATVFGMGYESLWNRPIERTEADSGPIVVAAKRRSRMRGRQSMVRVVSAYAVPGFSHVDSGGTVTADSAAPVNRAAVAPPVRPEPAVEATSADADSDDDVQGNMDLEAAVIAEAREFDQRAGFAALAVPVEAPAPAPAAEVPTELADDAEEERLPMMFVRKSRTAVVKADFLDYGD